MRRILILAASIGSGHMRAAEAMSIELRRLLPDAEITTVDFMARRISVLHSFFKWVYLTMLRFVPNIYDVFYHLAGRSTSGSWLRSAFAISMLPAMRSLLRRYEPDIVLCTHPFPEAAASLLRGYRPFFLATVMTDYSLHQIWLSHHVDCYFMATEAMRDGMIAEGFAPESLYVCGIPIIREVLPEHGRRDARRMLAIPDESVTILIMGGGLGLGGIEKSLYSIDTISEKMTLIVVTGHNDRLEERVLDFADRTHHNVLAFGYTDCIPLLMMASDFLITKPGALTMSEAFAMGLPMLLYDPIPGPETDNAIYAEERGAALWIHMKESTADGVRQLLDGRLPRMGEAARASAHPDAATEIARALLVAYKKQRSKIRTDDATDVKS